VFVNRSVVERLGYTSTILYRFSPNFACGSEMWSLRRLLFVKQPVSSVIELLYLSLTVEALQGKMCQNSLPSGGDRSLGAKIPGGRGRPWEYFLVSTKLDAFC